jgi:hypothetical protein
MLLVPLRSSSAKLKIQGKGKAMVLLGTQFSPEMQPRYELFSKKCTKCHAMARPIAALQTGITPVSGSVFDRKAMKKYVVKMMRKPNSGIAKADAREILRFIIYARKLGTDSEEEPVHQGTE